MKTQQLIERLNTTPVGVRNHAHLLRLGQCIRDAAQREDWDTVFALAAIALKVQGGAA
tara:strand:- start:662 stop:835 length:174 start_codon:yes stop_codon:yes gene_type:complete